jgi:hypothetical protein
LLRVREDNVTPKRELHPSSFRASFPPMRVLSHEKVRDVDPLPRDFLNSLLSADTEIVPNAPPLRKF